MKFLGTAALLFTLCACLAWPAEASAETISVEQKIVVQAKVMPAQYILVNAQGKIIEIGSNTNLDVIPQVFLNRPVSQNEQPLTPEIYTEYKSLIPSGKSYPGILYRYQAQKTIAKNGKLNLSFNI